MNTYLRHTLGLIIALLGALLVVSCDSPSQPVKIGAQLWPGYEPLFLAAGQGFLSADDAHLIQYSSSAESMRGLQNGVIEAAMVTLDEAASLRAAGVPIKIILVLDVSSGGDAVIGQPDVKQFEDLEGRTIGFEFSAVNAFVLCKAAAIHNLDCRQDFNKVNLALNDQFAAFAAKTVDAVVTFDPFKARLMRAGGQVLFDTNEIPEDVIDVLVVHETALKNGRGQIQAVVDAWFQALDYIAANPQQSAEIMGRRSQLSGEEFTEVIAGLTLGHRELNNRLLLGDPALLYAKLANTMQFMKQYELLSDVPNVQGIVDPEFLGNVPK